MPPPKLSPIQVEARRLLANKLTNRPQQSGSLIRSEGGTSMVDGRRGESVKNQTLLGG